MHVCACVCLCVKQDAGASAHGSFRAHFFLWYLWQHFLFFLRNPKPFSDRVLKKVQTKVLCSPASKNPFSDYKAGWGQMSSQNCSSCRTEKLNIRPAAGQSLVTESQMFRKQYLLFLSFVHDSPACCFVSISQYQKAASTLEWVSELNVFFGPAQINFVASGFSELREEH